MAERSWQCLETRGEPEIIGKRKEEVKVYQVSGDIADSHGTILQACVGLNASHLADSEAERIIAYGCDAMRASRQSGLHLPELYGDNAFFWRGCRSNRLGFSMITRCRSSTVKQGLDGERFRGGVSEVGVRLWLLAASGYCGSISIS